MKRMDRYKDKEQDKKNRTEKNRELYQDIVNNPKVANITDVSNANAFDLSIKNENASTRESFQQMRKYGKIEDVPKVKKELDDFNSVYAKKEKKIYDINSVLEEARKNRQEKDALDEKRKLKYTSYNIFSTINLEELAKYREEKKKRDMTPQEEGIHELMNTIASKTLAGEISKEETVELLSDLMATNVFDKVVPAEEIGDEKSYSEEPQIISTQEVAIEQKVEQPKEEVKEETNEDTTTSMDLDTIEENTQEVTQNSRVIDKDFYTKSMDLSTKDFEMANDFEDKGLPVIVKILIVLLVLAIIAAAGYFVYLKLK